jgi:hypothetical protein
MMKGLLAQVEKEVAIRGIDESLAAEVVRKIPALKNRRVVGGYASVTIMDREGHKITKEALMEATARFMNEVYYRPINVFHSDVTVGRVLPKWTNPKTGELVTSHVDDMGWYIVAEIRDYIEIADKVWEEVERGNIRSFSIAGSSKNKTESYEQGQSMTMITKLDIYEITLCEEPVNPMSKFDFFYNPNDLDIWRS